MFVSLNLDIIIHNVTSSSGSRFLHLEMEEKPDQENINSSSI